MTHHCWFRVLTLVLLVQRAGFLWAQPIVSPPVDRLFELVREDYRGDSALATTAYVEQRWRLPGNRGFDESIFRVRDILERAGFANAAVDSSARLVYRLERRPLSRPAWEPVDGSLWLAGETEPLLRFATNRNMIAINSYSTPPEGEEAEVVWVRDCRKMGNIDLKGKIAFGECSCGRLFTEAVQQRGAVGVLGFAIPAYNQPERYVNSIPFTGISLDTLRRAWAINLSYAAKEALKARLADGPLRIRVVVDTRLYAAEELTLVAEIRGSRRPGERFVFSAHVQEPGANDNASGVGCLAEMARVAAALVRRGDADPGRTITFLWGDEISATRRFIRDNPARATGIRWGVSLDMVGEDTDKTGGTFLIEKMPDPSAIWTRGEDRHTEWGAGTVEKNDLKPHYFNDFIEWICRRQAAATGWTVNTNPFEGGSDHQPFLDAGIPGLLFWHFTDAFYHTDGDRIDKVSPHSLSNVGVSALVAALTLSSADEATALTIADVVESAARRRLAAEQRLSLSARQIGRALDEERDILRTWGWWYAGALRAIAEVPVEGESAALQKRLAEAGQRWNALVGDIVDGLDGN